MSGDLFRFVNESRKLCKVLVLDGSCLCVFQKRLAQGCFAKLWRDDDQVVRLTQSELALFIERDDSRSTFALPAVIERKSVVSDRRMDQRRLVVRDDLEREQAIEELRRLALAIEAQNRRLLEALAKSQREVSHLRGKPSGDIQLTLKMLEELKAKAKVTHEAIERAAKKSDKSDKTDKTDKKPRSSSGPTAQPDLPIVERTFTLDDPDRTCTSCGGDLHPMKDQFEESEMIDVIEVRYELVKVKPQKYVCRCGGCVETAIGPTRALPGSRYSLAFAIKVLIDKWMARDYRRIARDARDATRGLRDARARGPAKLSRDTRAARNGRRRFTPCRAGLVRKIFLRDRWS
jgi:hypothetical protein